MLNPVEEDGVAYQARLEALLSLGTFDDAVAVGVCNVDTHCVCRYAGEVSVLFPGEGCYLSAVAALIYESREVWRVVFKKLVEVS